MVIATRLHITVIYNTMQKCQYLVLEYSSVISEKYSLLVWFICAVVKAQINLKIHKSKMF